MDANEPPQTVYGEARLGADRPASLRILDANANRAMEGLRVVEDYCRFGLGDALLTNRCKQLRHNLAAALNVVRPDALAAMRESHSDVGRSIKTADEIQRQSLTHICRASGQRVQQALRVIEEVLKLSAPQAAAQVEALRYESYALDKACRINEASRQQLAGAQLYVLVDGADSECAFVERVTQLLDAGVHVLQLRDKRLNDRTLLSRARLLRRVIDERPPPLSIPRLFLVNDRPDIAVLARADGVHVGQEELSVVDARHIVGPDLLIGVSTHTIEQARAAVLDGANYLGCGPTFPSATKQFDRFPGLDFLRQVAAEITLPAFAIGGITTGNVAQVLSTGFRRIAVQSGIEPASRQGPRFLMALGSATGSSE